MELEGDRVAEQQRRADRRREKERGFRLKAEVNIRKAILAVRHAHRQQRFSNGKPLSLSARREVVEAVQLLAEVLAADDRARREHYDTQRKRTTLDDRDVSVHAFSAGGGPGTGKRR